MYFVLLRRFVQLTEHISVNSILIHRQAKSRVNSRKRAVVPVSAYAHLQALL